MHNDLKAILAQCKAYVIAYKAEKATASEEQKKYCKAVIHLIPILQKALQEKAGQEEIPKGNSAIDFHERYNKNFAYLDKFTAVAQTDISSILHNQKTAKDLASFYSNIPPERIAREGKMLALKKKKLDQWLAAFSKMLANKDLKAALQKRFEELLASVNARLSEKGLANISTTSDNSPTV